jgi:transposase-like protein
MGRKPKCTVEEKVAAVEDYLNGTRSVSKIMVDLSINSTRTIRNWILAYQSGGIEALCPVTANHSYSKKFKIEMVQRYIAGEGSVTDLCSKYGIPGHGTLQKGISLYNANEELRDYNPKREVYMAEVRRKTTLTERKEIVEYCIAHNRDYKGTASLYDVSYGQVYSWVRKYDVGGEDGLSDKRGRHKTDDEVDELEQLRRENLRLKRQLEEKDMMVELLKKVKEFERM